MAARSDQEIQQIARKILDKPKVMRPVVDAMEQMVSENGFAGLDDEDLGRVLREVLTGDEEAKRAVFAGDGAQCCSDRCSTETLR